MKTSRILVLTLAVAAAGGAFMLASAPKPAPVEVASPALAPPPLPTDDVLVAGHEIAVGAVIADADLSWQSWPKTAVGAGMLTRASAPTALDDLRGSIVRQGFYPGEPIHREKLIKGTGTGFMSAILPSGKRAVAISIDSQGANTAGGFILPNDRVDVVRTTQDTAGKGLGPSAGNDFISETLLHNIRVLAIGQNVQEKNGQPVVVGSNATLELDPVQAETIILAQRTGQLSLTLRSMQDVNSDGDPARKKGDGTLTVVRFGVTSEGSAR